MIGTGENKASRRRRARTAQVAPAILLLVVATVVSFPLLWTFLSSLKSRSELFAYPPLFWPRSWNLGAYWSVLRETRFALWIANTLAVYAASLVGVVVLAAPAGYALSRFAFPGKGTVSHLILLTQMLPITLILVPMYVTFVQLNLIDSLASVILMLIAITAPIATWILKGFFDTIPSEIEEAAMIDGCTQLQALRSIVLPLSLPGLGAVTLFTFIMAWQQFIFSLTLVQSPSKAVLAVGLRYFLNQYSIEWNQILAASQMAIVIPVVMIFFTQGAFIRGLTGGALKG